MDKAGIYELLDKKGIRYEAFEHKAVFNMGELSGITLPYPERDAKNLFIRDDKKREYYLITVMGDKRVDLKEFRKANGTRPLTFASSEELSSLLALTPGSVTPLGLLNDEECKVVFFLDSAFLEGSGLIGVHPNENTATIFLRTADLIALIEEHGNRIETIAI